MEVMVLKHYSYKVMQRIEIKLNKKQPVEKVKEMISSFIEADKKDPFLTFVEYYIFSKDKDGYFHRYFKEIDLGKNTKRTLDNLPFVINLLHQIEQENKSHRKIKITTHIKK